MVLNIFIGYNPHLVWDNKYFINLRGIEDAYKDVRTFTNIAELINTLKEDYRHKKANIVDISEDFPEDDKKELIKFLEKRITKINYDGILINT